MLSELHRVPLSGPVPSNFPLPTLQLWSSAGPVDLRVSACRHQPALLAKGMPCGFRPVKLKCCVSSNKFLRNGRFWPPGGQVHLRLLPGTSLRGWPDARFSDPAVCR